MYLPLYLEEPSFSQAALEYGALINSLDVPKYSAEVICAKCRNLNLGITGLIALVSAGTPIRLERSIETAAQVHFDFKHLGYDINVLIHSLTPGLHYETTPIFTNEGEPALAVSMKIDLDIAEVEASLQVSANHDRFSSCGETYVF